MKKKIAGAAAVTMLFLSGAFLGIIAYHHLFPPVIRVEFNNDDVSLNRPIPDTKGFAPLFEAWLLLNQRHLKPPPGYKMIDGAIDGLVRSAGDPHTRYLPPARGQTTTDSPSSSFSGIGAVITVIDGDKVIMRPLPDSPAKKTGLLSGDIIESVNGQSAKPLSLEQVVRLIRGPTGTEIVLTVRRNGRKEPLTVKLTRQEVEYRSVVLEMRRHNGHKLAVIALHGFTMDSPDEMASAIRRAKMAKAEGVILDLRDNGGGLMFACRQIASAWIGDKTVTWVYGRGDFMEARPAIETDGLTNSLKEMPTAVLINSHSASASEMLAAALRDHGIAKLIGEKSRGKGSVQVVNKLSNNGLLRITIQHFRSPNKTVINGQGLKPDSLVRRLQSDIKSGRDPQLRRALDTLVPTPVGRPNSAPARR